MSDDGRRSADIAASTGSDRPHPGELPEIERLRGNIDEVDTVLVKLLNQRASWALEIGAVKRSHGLAIYQPDREARVMERVTGANRGPLAADAVRRLFERIIDESRRLERSGSAD